MDKIKMSVQEEIRCILTTELYDINELYESMNHAVEDDLLEEGLTLLKGGEPNV